MLDNLALFDFEGLDPCREPTTPEGTATLGIATVIAAFLLNSEQTLDGINDGQLKTVAAMVLMGNLTKATVMHDPSIVEDGLEVVASLDAAMLYMLRMDKERPAWVGHCRSAVKACTSKMLAVKAMEDATR